MNDTHFAILSCSFLLNKHKYVRENAMLVIVNSLLLSFLQFGVPLLRIVVFSFLLLVIRRRLVIGERFKAKRDTDFVRLLQADTFLHDGWLEKGGNGRNTR